VSKETLIWHSKYLCANIEEVFAAASYVLPYIRLFLHDAKMPINNQMTLENNVSLEIRGSELFALLQKWREWKQVTVLIARGKAYL